MGEWAVIVWLVVGSSGLCFMDNKGGIMECMYDGNSISLSIRLSV